MLRSKLWQAPLLLRATSCPLQRSPLAVWRAPGSLLQLSVRPLSAAQKQAKEKNKKNNVDPNTKSRRRPRKEASKEARKHVPKKGPSDKTHKTKTMKDPLEERDDFLDIMGSLLAGGAGEAGQKKVKRPKQKSKDKDAPKTLKEALLGTKSARKRKKEKEREKLDISIIHAKDLNFDPIHVQIPPVPMLSYGLDRVLFNPGIYLLQDPRSRVYNFDPYLEKILPVNEFDFDALSEYKTSSKDPDLLNLTKKTGALFTGSTSSMSGVLQHFHYLLSSFRPLSHQMLSREFPEPSAKFSQITLAPSAIFLRYKDGIYAIDADKSYDTPNIMSWLGHSLEKLLTTDRTEFERYRRSNTEKPPIEDKSDRCYHYSKQGNLLMRSQLDALDPRLPGTGVFDLKTRAVVSIRMDHQRYEVGSGYQLRKARGQWESFEREFYDMTRATLLKYSLQVRMGRMDGIFVAFHNIERIFGFQYLSLPDMDIVLHGQHDTSLGNEEFRLSLALLDELLGRAIAQLPNTSLRIHVEARDLKTNFMYVFVEPVTESEADRIQASGEAAQKEFARNVVGIGKDDPEVQAAWQEIQDEVDDQVDEDESGESRAQAQIDQDEEEEEEEEEEEDDDDDDDDEEEEEEEAAEETMTANEIGEAEAKQEEAVGNDMSLEDGLIDLEVEALPEGSSETNAESDDSTEDVSENEIAASGEDATETESSNENLEKSNDPEMATAVGDPPEFLSDDAEATNSPVNAAPKETSRGPLLAWTLTIRNKVNGEYVDRPENYTEEDDWRIEYYIQDIPEKNRWKLYDALVKRRRDLIGPDEERDERLKQYRELIHGYSSSGREWRKEQDKMDEAKGVQLYKPLGPGSGAHVVQTGNAEDAP